MIFDTPLKYYGLKNSSEKILRKKEKERTKEKERKNAAKVIVYITCVI